MMFSLMTNEVTNLNRELWDTHVREVERKTWESTRMRRRRPPQLPTTPVQVHPPTGGNRKDKDSGYIAWAPVWWKTPHSPSSSCPKACAKLLQLRPKLPVRTGNSGEQASGTPSVSVPARVGG